MQRMQILDAVDKFGVEVGTEDDKPTKHGKEGGSGKSKGVPVAVELYVNEFTGVDKARQLLNGPFGCSNTTAQAGWPDF